MGRVHGLRPCHQQVRFSGHARKPMTYTVCGASRALPGFRFFLWKRTGGRWPSPSVRLTRQSELVRRSVISVPASFRKASLRTLDRIVTLPGRSFGPFIFEPWGILFQVDGFFEETRMLDRSTKAALGEYAVRGAVREQRISYDSYADVVTWSARANGFFEQLGAHLQPRRAQLVRRYGLYSSRVGSKWTEMPVLGRSRAP